MTKLNEAAYERSLCQALVDSGYDQLSPQSDWPEHMSARRRTLSRSPHNPKRCRGKSHGVT